MNRRELFSLAGKGAVLMPLIGARDIAKLAEPPPPVLPPINAGSVLSAKAINDMVDAINELRAGRQ